VNYLNRTQQVCRCVLKGCGLDNFQLSCTPRQIHRKELDKSANGIYNDSIVTDYGVIILPTSRKVQKEQTREKLLEVAISEFGSRGIMATRISDIAAAAGLSHGTVFVHFKSQDEFLVAVIERFGERTVRRMHELASKSVGIRGVLEAHLQGIMEFEAFYSRLVIEARLLPQEARQTLIVVQSAASFHISQAAQKEMDSGAIMSIPIPLLFNTWIGLVDHYLTNGDLFAPEGSVLKRYGPVLLDHYMNLISIH
jgi:AcrR family transcriptional regulator